MRIGQCTISQSHPPYIIAEIGVNHDGDPARALELTRSAAHAGADAIKLQLFEADRLMSGASRLAGYQQIAGESDPREMLRRLELPIDAMTACVELAHAQGIHAIVSVFSLELVAVAERLAWDAYKTASPDIINKPLLDALATTGRPLIVSTGASTLDEVGRAVAWLRPASDRLALLHCVSCYPTEPTFATIGAVRHLAAAFGLATGYSDHTTAVDTGLVAVAAGALVLEKHLTYSRAARGPDHAASLDPQQFREYVRLAKLQASRGRWDPDQLQNDPRVGAEIKRVLSIEEDVRTVSRQSLTMTRDVPAGHVLTRDDLTIKRPGTGIPPFELEATVGRRVRRSLRGDAPLNPDDLEPVAG